MTENTTATREQQLEEYVLRSALEKILDKLVDVDACYEILRPVAPEGEPTLISCELIGDTETALWPDRPEPYDVTEEPEYRRAEARAATLAGRVLLAVTSREGRQELQDRAFRLLAREPAKAAA